MSLLSKIEQLRATGRKGLAILVDPDKTSPTGCTQLLAACAGHQPDCFMVGGSLITSPHLEAVVAFFKQETEVPVLLFPGHYSHVCPQADALMFLSLISGRNPEYLIGQHVVAAPHLRRSGLEIIATGYLLVHGGNLTTVAYMSNTTPLPPDKPDLTAATALAGEMLGLKMLYLDAGSGAQWSVPPALVEAARSVTQVPLIVGGGIREVATLRQLYAAGADLAVIGTASEQQPGLLPQLLAARYAG
ncbi:MAG: geranylgeranylglyceryl/heptaprenylglyceryl phosphate synthase [Bernardetiaceae bacterium]|jgi:putative glycerol-1-phosphate prenyltransferase|nr:geranylgeranylglyceryl/heptaprenylglyceryl phosphate synthase [Bernardetiaceae bacterium]